LLSKNTSNLITRGTTERDAKVEKPLAVGQYWLLNIGRSRYAGDNTRYFKIDPNAEYSVEINRGRTIAFSRNLYA